MKKGLFICCLLACALMGCEKASQPAATAERQPERKEQASAPAPAALWSKEFKDQTLKECIQHATANGDSEGVRKCRCVVDKAAATITEERFKAIGTDAQVKATVKQIGATC